jgi:hypothetical protein
MGSQSSNQAAHVQRASDVVLVYGKSDDGKGYDVLRRRGEELQAGKLRPLDDGKPIYGQVVRLTPRHESPALFDVDVQHDGRGSTGRPAKVASDQYREGWDSIWANGAPNRALN